MALDHAAGVMNHAARDVSTCPSTVTRSVSPATASAADRFAAPTNTAAQRTADWAALPAELLRKVAAAIMASGSSDWSATLAARNALRGTCRAWRDACPVRLRLLNSLPSRRRGAWWRLQYPGLDALVAAVDAAIRDAAGGVLGRSTFVNSRHMSGLPSAPACAAVRTFVARLGRRAKRKLLSEIIRRVGASALAFLCLCVPGLSIMTAARDPCRLVATCAPSPSHVLVFERLYTDPLPCSVAWLWRSWLRRLPACTVTLDLRWSHVAVSDDMDPLGSRQGRGAGSHRASPAAARRLPVWYLAEVAQGVLPLAVTELIELCEGLQQVKSVTIPMLNRVSDMTTAWRCLLQLTGFLVRCVGAHQLGMQESARIASAAG